MATCFSIGYLIGGILLGFSVKNLPRLISPALTYLTMGILCAAIAWGDVWVIGKLSNWADRSWLAIIPGGLIASFASVPGIPAMICAAIEIIRPELATKAQTQEFILSSAKEIYLFRDGQNVGPFEEMQLRMWMVEGKVDANEWAWCDGMTTWMPLMNLFAELTKNKLASRNL